MRKPLLQPITRQVTFVFDAGSHRQLVNVQLKGSFQKATGAFDPAWGGGDVVPMKPAGDGKWSVTLPLLDDGLPHDWRWGVIADGPAGKAQWAVMGEGPLRFELGEHVREVSYALTTYERMGARSLPNGDASFRFWAPNAKSVTLKVSSPRGQVQRFPMTREADGIWQATVARGWSGLVGKAYVYEIVDSAGRTTLRPDPYSRQMQGEQRGIGRTYLDLRTGSEVNAYYLLPDVARPLTQKYGSWAAVPKPEKDAAYAASRAEFLRFDVDHTGSEDEVTLLLRDARGRQLTRAQLVARIGAFDPRMDPSLAGRLRGGQYDELWSRNVAEDGTVRLVREGDAWTVLFNNPEKLVGLRYELQVWTRDAQGKRVLAHDVNRDSRLSTDERRAAPENDPWSDELTPTSGKSFRQSVIVDARFDWKNDAAPRERDPARWVIEQIHVGSVFGTAGNSDRSTFKDLLDRLSYFKRLGVNTLEVLPINEFEGGRDWGYMGASTLAVESSYGFEDDDGRWVNSLEALKRFIDAAHGQGLNVLNDVVYNHVAGEENFLWNLDGEENPYFNWARTPGPIERKDTPWGAMPAYNNPRVRQFFVDHAVAQLEELHFDGLRFDFTQPIKQEDQGGRDGWEMLREINRQLHFLNPAAFTAAEQFDYDPAITTPTEHNGAGFDAQWYTEFQHRIVHDNDNPSLIQQAVSGHRTEMDRFMDMLVSPRGLTSWRNGVTIISNHDEVGNAQRTIVVASGGNLDPVPSPYARGLARLAAGIGFASPGIPLFFQGDESLARNPFAWGVPSTWDSGWSWESLGDKDDQQVLDGLATLPPAEREPTLLDLARRQTFRFYADAIALRRSNPALQADAEVYRVFTHDEDSVMAFGRRRGGEELLVVASLNREPLSHYPLPFPSGRWQEIFNSDAARYGGSNVGNGGATLNGGDTRVSIPAAGYVVFKRVG